MKYNVVGVNFQDKIKIYYFLTNNLNLKLKEKVIVETDKGLQIGMIVSENREISDKEISAPLKKVIRLANEEDLKKEKENFDLSKKALIKCRELINKNNMDMQLTEAAYNFDKSQLIFYFVSDKRIDFRNLVKDLASIYHTRIEMRQIGVRDKSKEIGGIGLCGRELCCKNHLKDFDSVSICMAKNQNIALNPTKINGCCGRLLCCLKYEDDQYLEYRKTLPEINQKVSTKDGEGKVISIDIYKQTYKVLLNNNEIIEIKVKDK